MQIIITPTGGPAFTLGDDSVSVLPPSPPLASGAGGQIKEGFVSRQRRQVQKSGLFRAPYQQNIQRYNWENRFAFTVQRTFSTLEDCFNFIASHADNVPASGEITLTNTSATGTIKRYLPNAIVESVECVKQVGLSCDFQYTISGNGAWQTTP